MTENLILKDSLELKKIMKKIIFEDLDLGTYLKELPTDDRNIDHWSSVMLGDKYDTKA